MHAQHEPIAHKHSLPNPTLFDPVGKTTTSLARICNRPRWRLNLTADTHEEGVRGDGAKEHAAARVKLTKVLSHPEFI